MEQPIELSPEEEVKEALLSEEEVKVDVHEEGRMSDEDLKSEDLKSEDLKSEDLKSEDIGSGNLSDNIVNTSIEPVTEGNDVKVSICSCDLTCCIS